MRINTVVRPITEDLFATPGRVLVGQIQTYKSSESNGLTHVLHTTNEGRFTHPTLLDNQIEDPRAARWVNVINKVRSGSSPWRTQWAMRCTRVCVFPVPAPATTKVGRSGASTTAICCGSSVMSSGASSLYQIAPQLLRCSLERSSRVRL